MGAAVAQRFSTAPEECGHCLIVLSSEKEKRACRLCSCTSEKVNSKKNVEYEKKKNCAALFAMGLGVI